MVENGHWTDGARLASADAVTPGPRPIEMGEDGQLWVVDDGKGVFAEPAEAEGVRG